MKGHFKLDTTQFEKAAAELASLPSKKPVQEVMRQAAGQVVRRAVDITPPSTGKASHAAKKAGEQTIATDISRIFSVISSKHRAILMDSPTPGEHGKTFAHAGAAAIGTLTDKVLSRSQMMAWLKERRNKSTGRVGKIKGGGTTNWERAMSITTGLRAMDLKKMETGLVSRGDYKWFVKEIQKSVGYLAAGWVPAARKLGVRLPAWIMRHRAPGYCDVTVSKTGIRVQFGNEVAFADNVRGLQRRFQSAVNYVAKNILEKQVPAAVNNLARKAGFKVS